MSLPYQPVLDTVEVRMEYILSGESCENVFHVTKGPGDPWTLVQEEDLASTFSDWEDGTGKAQRSTAAALHNITVTDLGALTGLRLTRPVVPPIVGTVTGDALPNNATFALKADVHNRGRGKSGRTFWIGLAESQVAGSTIGAAARDAIVDGLNGLITAVEALDATYFLSVPHRKVNNVRPAEAIATRVYLFSATDDTVDSQKNRLPNHRRRSVRVLR